MQLSWGGDSAAAHRFARDRLDLAAVARHLLGRLGVATDAAAGEAPVDRLSARLAELGGSPSSRAHRRALRVAAPFSGAQT